jgi:DNA invertase Pin-like site-specific DNA recombinase
MNISDLIQPRHHQRHAAIYIRQSTGQQVTGHQESTRLQYALKQRAIDLGWHEHDVKIIDSDLGETAVTMENRQGFQKLVSQITLGEIGIVIAYDATRLARNCSHWYQLLDLCGHADCLIGDRDGVYDPSSINGRLLLGLKGQISELELHTIRARMTAGLLNKAKRGELAIHLPSGLQRLPSGIVVKNPDLLVQDRLQMVFDLMLQKRTLNQVVQYFRQNDLGLPCIDRFGDTRWATVTVDRIGKILHNPAYAGAFVYGRSRYEKDKTTGKTRQIRIPRSQWKICVFDKYPAYISWETFERIQSMLEDNYSEYSWRNSRGVVRNGEALLHGLVYCGQCGYKMRVRYETAGGAYICNQMKHEHGVSDCQHLSIGPIDNRVVEWFFDVLSESKIDIAAKTLREADKQQDALFGTRQREIERLRYQARLAERQYQYADPENRLVAAELERRWEVALQELKSAEEAIKHDRSKNSSLTVPADLIESLKDVGARLPEIWTSGLFKSSQKKSLLRCLIDKVVLHRELSDQVHVRVIWKGGETTEDNVRVRVNSLAQCSDVKEIEEAIVRFANEGKNDEQIANELTLLGHKSPLSEVFLTTTVGNVRRRLGVYCRPGRTKAPFATGFLTVYQIADQTKIPARWIYDRIYNGSIVIEKNARTRCYLFPDNLETLEKLRQLRRGDVTKVNF